MDRLEFEAELRREGYSIVNSSLKPNMVAENHCHDFDAKLLVLGGEITITRDNKPETFRAGQCCAVQAGCMHAEYVGPEGVAFLSGRRRNGGPLTREAFESDLRREGYEVVHGGQQAGHVGEPHAHDFDVRIMVLGGEITLIRDGKPETFRAGDHCEVPAGCVHGEQVGPEGVAYIAGKANRRAVASLEDLAADSRDPSSSAPNRTSPKRNRCRQNPAVTYAIYEPAHLRDTSRRPPTH